MEEGLPPPPVPCPAQRRPLLPGMRPAGVHASLHALLAVLQISHDNALDMRPYEHMLKVLGQKKQRNGCTV